MLLWQASFYFAWRSPAVWQLCDTQPKHKRKPGRFRHSNDVPAHEKCSAHLMRQPFSPLRETRSLPFSFQKSLSLSEWPFTAGPFAKCLSPQQSSSDQCEQSGQMIFRNDLLSNSSQFTFLCPESPWGVRQAAGGPRCSQLAVPLQIVFTTVCVCFQPSLLTVESAVFPSLSGIWLRFNMHHPTRE